jgi:hypothetical protein
MSNSRELPLPPLQKVCLDSHSISNYVYASMMRYHPSKDFSVGRRLTGLLLVFSFSIVSLTVPPAGSTGETRKVQTHLITQAHEGLSTADNGQAAKRQSRLEVLTTLLPGKLSRSDKPFVHDGSRESQPEQSILLKRSLTYIQTTTSSL